MFEADFYDLINTEFPELQLGFGEVDESLEAPYAVMYVLSRSGKRATVCEDDQYESGNSFIQFNVFTQSSKYGLKLIDDLDKYINGLRHISGATEYDVYSTDQTSTTSLSSTNGLAVSVLAKTLNYEEK